ncbi:hypothetical protein AB3S75_040313 [Citrus x aurantiifolia]
MSTRSNKMQNLLRIFHHYRASSINNSKGHIPRVTVAKLRHGYSMHQGLHLISSNGESWRKQDTHMAKSGMNNINGMNNNNPPVPTPAPSKFNFSLWAKWILGSILSLLLPFWKQKWEKLKQIEGEAEIVIEEVEKAAEVVEKVATVAENVSAEVTEKLPDHTKFKDAALFVERVAKETAHDAQLTENFFHKVDEVKQDINDLEKLVEPVVDKFVEEETK